MKRGAKARNAPRPFSRHALLLPTFLYARFFLFILRCISRLEGEKALRWSKAVNPLFTFLFRQQRKRNIHLLLPPSRFSSAERRQLERDYLDYIARLRVEITRFFRIRPDQIRQNISLSGEEHLRAALDEGRGVLLLGCHFGNWNCTAPVLTLLGYDVTSVLNPDLVPGAGFQRTYEQLAAKFRCKLSFVGQNAYLAAKESFRRNAIFYVNLDVAVRSSHSQW